MKTPLVYIVIVNYNGWKDTIECVKSLKNISYNNYKIIVVDNYSTDQSCKEIKSRYPDVILIENKENSGFSGGNNIGIKIAIEDNASYVLLLNNDTVVENDFLLHLVDAAEVDSNVGIVGGKIYFYDNKDFLWFAGAKINTFTGFTNHIGWNEEDNGQYDDVCESDYITGCMMLVKIDAIKNVGLMDEKYFLYYEEADWCVRFKKAGYKVIYIPKAKIFHKVSASTKNLKNSVRYYFDRNSVYFISKNYGFINKIFINIYMRFKLIYRLLKSYILNDRSDREVIKMTLRSINRNELGMFRKVNA